MDMVENRTFDEILESLADAQMHITSCVLALLLARKKGQAKS